MDLRGIIISDTHASDHGIFSDAFLDEVKKSDFLIHAGDWEDAGVYEFLSFYVKVFGVFGNCDDYSLRRILPEVRSITIGGIDIGVIHGQRKHSSYIAELDSMFADREVVIYGHTHIARKDELNGKVFFNPGSFSYPRQGTKRSYGIMNITSDGYELEHVFF